MLPGLSLENCWKLDREVDLSSRRGFLPEANRNRKSIDEVDYASFKLANPITKWFVYIAAILYALYSLGLPILTTTVLSFIFYLPIFNWDLQ